MPSPCNCARNIPCHIDLEKIDGQREEALIEHLLQFVTPEKRERMETVIASRTSRIQVVLEDIFQPHNASAAMRSCECFGIQHLHVIETNNTYKLNREVAMGSSKWINLHRYNEENTDNTATCLQTLRKQGFQIAATSLNKDSIPLDKLPVDKKIALWFGTEEEGLSKQVLQEADVHVHIPMFGFTQSFNISVSVALCLYELRKRLNETDGWHLEDSEKRAVWRFWLKNSLRNADILENTFLKQGVDG